MALKLMRSAGIEQPASLIDVGCGWGVNLSAFEAAGYRICGLDTSRQILDLIDQPGRSLIQADLTQPLPANHAQYEAGLMLDVLEHLDDDRGALRRVARLIRPGGMLIVSVPALPELFSEYDRMQGHRRRYTAESFRSIFEDSGFSVVDQHWWGAWMVPILKRMRRDAGGPAKSYSDYLRIPPWPVPLLMRGFYELEALPSIRKRLTVGTSLIAILARNQS
ncbi:MAG TPA: class I SAM-dependent methyltransferase [Polyangiaceae bacterium]